MRRSLLALTAVLLLPAAAGAQISFLWLQFLEPVATSLDLPACVANTIEENRARIVQGPTTPSIWYCPVGGGSWIELAGGEGGGAVSSVFGRTGDVIAEASDYDAALLDYTPAVGTDWNDPDPTTAEQGFDDLAARLTVEEAKPDDAGTDDQTAAEVPFTPAGGISATDTQAAVEEVEADAGAALTAHAGNASAHHVKTTDAAEITSGTLAHERGGLEADVSAFGGLVRIAAGSTTAVSTLAGLNTALGSTVADGAHFTPDADPGVDHASYVAGHGDGTDCDPGEYARGTDGAGNAELCTADADTAAGKTFTGADAAIVTGTAGADTDCAQWNADGDLVTSGGACGGADNIAEGRAASVGTTFAVVPGFYCSGAMNTWNSGAARVYYEPIIVQTAITATGIGAVVSTAAAGESIRMGIYQADTSWQPGALVIDGGTTSVASTGLVSVTFSQALPAGRYVLALATESANPTFWAMSNCGPTIIQPTWINQSNVTARNLYVGKAFGALADPGTAWDTVALANLGFYRLMRVNVGTP